MDEQPKKKRGRPPKPENHYIDNDELVDEIRKAQQRGYASEKLGKMLLLMHQQILKHSNFSGYSKELKEDMMSFSIQKILKGLNTFDLRKKAKCFGYYSHAIFNNYIYIVMKHYKYINGWRGLYKATLQKLVDSGLVSYADAKRFGI